MLVHTWQWRIQGGGGPDPPPLLGYDVGFLTLGPKLAPPFLRVDLRCSGGSRGGGDRGDHPPLELVPNVQEWGCFSIFRRVDDVTQTMSKGGGVLVNVFTPLQEIVYPRLRWTPPPFKNPGSAPAWPYTPGLISNIIRSFRHILMNTICSDILTLTHSQTEYHLFIKLRTVCRKPGPPSSLQWSDCYGAVVVSDIVCKRITTILSDNR